MDAGAALRVLDRLAGAGIAHWVAGGWGVDALVGEQTRLHQDLDLVVDASRFDEAVQTVVAMGYRPDVDWLPARLSLVADTTDGSPSVVDLHPVHRSADGSGTQPGLGSQTFRYPADAWALGWIDGRPVPCLAARQQRTLHAGYDLRDEDRHDLPLLDEVAARTMSALVVQVPAAEPVVQEHRRQLDPSAALGVRAHLTVLFPFLPPDRLSMAALAAVATVVQTVPAFDLVLDKTAWFGDQVLYLAPQDPGPLAALTERLVAAFPDCPPYGGVFDEVVPHLTVGDGAGVDALRRAEAAVTPQLPVRQQVEEVRLLVGSDTVFRDVMPLPLRPTGGAGQGSM